MGIVDEDGRPVRGAGALPYAGASGGTGDMSGVSFTRNILEKPPSTTGTQSKFMSIYDQVMKDVAAGKLPDADIADVPGAKGRETAEERKERQRAQMAKARAAKQVKRGAKSNGGAVAVPESEVQEQGKRGAGKRAEVRGHDQGPGVSPNGMPDLPRPGSDSGTGVPAARQDDQASGQSIQSQLTEKQLRAAIIVATQPFHINVQQIVALPVEQCEHIINELRAQTAALGETINAKRQEEQGEDLSKCMWCGEPYPHGKFFARTPFEIPPMSGQWQSVHSCQKGACLAKFNEMSDRLMRAIKAERGA